MTLDEGGFAYTYEVRIKPAAGEQGVRLPSFEPPANRIAALGKFAYVLVGLMALAMGAAVYALLQMGMQRKREATESGVERQR